MKDQPNIFIADDDEDDINLLKTNLVERNTQVSCTTFHNGLVLINYLLVNPDIRPDLIVLDINMPIKNGFITLHELKNNQELADIPVIMLSGSSRKDDINRCEQMGCHSYFVKPVSAKGFTELAERLLLMA
jgi:CheY-like chemotaxis protein